MEIRAPHGRIRVALRLADGAGRSVGHARRLLSISLIRRTMRRRNWRSPSRYRISLRSCWRHPASSTSGSPGASAWPLLSAKRNSPSAHDAARLSHRRWRRAGGWSARASRLLTGMPAPSFRCCPARSPSTRPRWRRGISVPARKPSMSIMASPTEPAWIIPGARPLGWSYIDAPLSTVIGDIGRFYPREDHDKIARSRAKSA